MIQRHKTLALCIALCTLPLICIPASAQIKTAKGDFFKITRTVEQTADSVEFISDTLKVTDTAGSTNDFQNGDSVCVFFVQNRFKIVNNRLTGSAFDYVVAATTLSTGMSLARAAQAGDIAQAGNVIGLRPVHRPVGNIASTSTFNEGPSAVRQFLTFRLVNPSSNRDGFGLRRILFKPNINYLTKLAAPPDTTKDTLRAYLLDDGTGNVVGQTDLAIVRLLPGTTRILVWVKDSAQAVDAGEYIGSFGDYSRGRYFLGDDGLSMATTVTPEFRPTNINPVTGGPNPDYGMVIDGFPPEANSIRNTNLFYALAAGGSGSVGGGYSCSPPNPQYGLIPPYRVGEYAVGHGPYQAGLVSSAVDTLRFLDAWGNRTWDASTTPSLKALQWNSWGTGGGTPVDRTNYLKNISDILRQVGQVVYRKLAYTHADLNPNDGLADSMQIVASAVVSYRAPGNVPAQLNAIPDTSGGFPRRSNQFFSAANLSIRQFDWLADNDTRITSGSDGNGHALPIVYEPDRTPVDPGGISSLPATGVKITVRPNIPRRIYILPKNIINNQPVSNFTVGDKIKLEITVVDGYGNIVDDNERFKFEMSPFSERFGGFFDSLTQPAPSTAGVISDSGRVSVALAANIGKAERGFSAATGSNNAGNYRVRVRASWALNDRFSDLNDPLKRDINPGPGFNHFPDIPDGSPNNNFGFWVGPGPIGCGSAGFGNKVGQTVAMDSINIFASPVTPVELAALNVHEINQGLLVTWQTESEMNNAGFFVERSFNASGSSWSQLGFVKGKGTTTERQYYSFSDNEALEKHPVKIFYRLRQVDLDGTPTYSHVIEFTPQNSTRTFSLSQNYPNPVSLSKETKTSISYSIPYSSTITITLYDLLGHELRTIASGAKDAGAYSVDVDLTSLPKGMYIYKLFSGSSGIATKRLIIID